MAELKKELKIFWGSKCFAAGLLLIAVLSYATLLLDPTIGIDDTSFKLYYVDGVSPYMGRWCIYLINKLFPLNYNPYFVGAVGLLCFCVSISLWCIVFYRLFKDRLSMPVYMVFGGVMISSPIISEVVIWYLQDGIFWGYGVTALSLLFAMDAFRVQGEHPLRKRVGKILVSAAFLAIAMGFYESFMIVFFMGALFVFLLIRFLKDTGYSGKISHWLANMAGIGVASMIFRTVAIKGIVAVFHLESQAGILRSRDLSDITEVLFGWFSSSSELEKLGDIIREFFVKYYCNGVVYLPITVLVMAVIIVLIWAIWKTVEKRDGWILLAAVGIILLPLLLALAEGVATYYRSSQYIPLISAFPVLIVAWEGRRCQTAWVRGIGIFLAVFLLYQQAYEMNKWLYVDALKYEDDKRTMDAVALELLENCDTSKPVCVIGNYQAPDSILEKAYCPTWSKKYVIIKELVTRIDPELFEKYDSPQGYVAAETPLLSTLNWANKAFYGFDREMIKFWKMHGFTFVEDGNLDHYTKAKEMMQNGPVWPQKGSVVELEEYIIVNFGNYE